MARDERPLRIWKGRYRACMRPPVMGPMKRSSATSRSASSPAKRSMSAAGSRPGSTGGMNAARAIFQNGVAPKIRDEILEGAAALGGKGFSAHFGQQRWLVSRQPALRAIFSRYGWDFRGFQTQICRWRLIVRLPKSTTSARDHDVSGMAPPSRMMRAHRSRIVANISNMAAPICKKICRPWRTILPAV